MGEKVKEEVCVQQTHFLLWNPEEFLLFEVYYRSLVRPIEEH